jgi:hypothetical protein
MASGASPSITVDLSDGGTASPPSKLKKFVYGSIGLAVFVTAAVLFWKFWYCPGHLGVFSWFRCKCKANATRGKDRRCACDAFFNEVSGACSECGDLQQPCCTQGLQCHSIIDPQPDHYQCNAVTKICESERQIPGGG